MDVITFHIQQKTTIIYLPRVHGVDWRKQENETYENVEMAFLNCGHRYLF